METDEREWRPGRILVEDNLLLLHIVHIPNLILKMATVSEGEVVLNVSIIQEVAYDRSRLRGTLCGMSVNTVGKGGQPY